MTLRRFFVSVTFLILVSVVLHAARISDTEARSVAVSFFSSGSIRGAKSPSAVKLAYASADEEYYVFNNGADGGYVVVSGEEIAQPVLGYADSGTFDTQSAPPALQAWLEEYASQVSYVRTHPGSRLKTSAQTSVKHPVVRPLLGGIIWNQSAPYNNLCPTYKNSSNSTVRTVTGCVATAMAQVMAHYRWPLHGTGSHSYLCALNKDSTQMVTLSADFSRSTYDWDNILPYYDDNSGEAAETAVAKLLSDCGISVDMGYGSSSGAVTRRVVGSLGGYFDYDGIMEWHQRNSYTLASWLQLIDTDLVAERPMVHTGTTVSGGGHAFVVDGSRGDGYYHINWGWGGKSNGYFVFTDLTPSEQGIGSSDGGYNNSQGLITGIRPNEGSAKRLSVFAQQFYANTSSVSLGSSMTLTFRGMGAVMPQAGNVTFYRFIALCDENDNILEVPISRQCSNWSPGSSYRADHTYTPPKTLKDGTYRLRLMYAPTSTDALQPVKIYRTSNPYIIMTVANGKALFSEPQRNSELIVENLSYQGEPCANRDLLVEATLTNEGWGYLDDVYVALEKGNGTIAYTGAARKVAIDEGGTAKFSMVINAAVAKGDYNIVILDSEKNVVPGVKKAVSIGAEPANFSMSIVSPLRVANDYMPSRNIQASAVVKNTGGTFNGVIEIMLQAEGSTSIIQRVSSQFISVKQGESATVYFKSEFAKGVPDGRYTMVLRNPKDLSKYYVWGSKMPFTIGEPVACDVNLDRQVNVSDVTTVVNYILGQSVFPFDDFAADSNSDGEVNVTDVTSIVSAILGAE